MSRLVVLVADLDAETAIRGLLSRPDALRVRLPACEVQRHYRHDPGVWNEGVDFLRVIARRDDHVLVVFDHEGSGQEGRSAEKLEQEMQAQLKHAGWQDHAGVVVIDPELEAWVWSDSPNVGRILGMADSEYQKVRRENVSGPGGKPLRPKELMKETLRKNGTQQSSSIFGELASRVSFERCTDRSFLKLKSVLRQWFGLGNYTP